MANGNLNALFAWFGWFAVCLHCGLMNQDVLFKEECYKIVGGCFGHEVDSGRGEPRPGRLLPSPGHYGPPASRVERTLYRATMRFFRSTAFPLRAAASLGSYRISCGVNCATR